MSDRDQFYEWLIMFNRPAWRGPFDYRTDPRPFIQAIDDTILALDTGKFVSRGGKDLPHRALGVAHLRDQRRREEMTKVLDRLRRIREMASQPAPADSQLAVAADLSGAAGGAQSKARTPIDRERDAVIDELNRLWADLGIQGVPRPSEVEGWQEVFAE